MIFLVNDANILIDLLKINLLDSFFRLEFDFQVTDMVFAEILLLFFPCRCFLFLFFPHLKYLNRGGGGGTGHISVRLLQTDCAEKFKGKNAAILWSQGLSASKKE